MVATTLEPPRDPQGALGQWRDVAWPVAARGEVRGLSFSIRPGECVVVTGPSSANLHGLLLATIGLGPLVGGDISLFGRSIADRYHDELMRIRTLVSLASSSAPLAANLSVRQNLELPLVIRGLPPAEVRPRVDAILEEFGLGAYASHRSGEMSSVLEARAELARAFVSPVQLLLLDRPLRACEWGDAGPLLDLLAARLRRGAGLVITAHHLGDLGSVATQIIDVRGMLTLAEA